MPGFDIIGDIHGQADALDRLLDLLGYRLSDGVRRHPDGRRAVFLGDFIDRVIVRKKFIELYVVKYELIAELIHEGTSCHSCPYYGRQTIHQALQP